MNVSVHFLSSSLGLFIFVRCHCNRRRIRHRCGCKQFSPYRLQRNSSMLRSLFAGVKLILAACALCLHRNVFAIYNGVNIHRYVGRWRRHRYTAVRSTWMLDWWFRCSSWCLTAPWPTHFAPPRHQRY